MLEKWVKIIAEGLQLLYKDQDSLIEQSWTALDQQESTKRSRCPNRAVTVVWNTLTEQSHKFECFRLCNKPK